MIKVDKEDLQKIKDIRKEIMTITDKYFDNNKSVNEQEFVKALDMSLEKLIIAGTIGLGNEPIFVKDEFSTSNISKEFKSK